MAAALLVKAHRAKAAGGAGLDVWGSGTPRREFLYVDDLADALVFLMQTYSGDEHINVGSGTDVTIRELAETTMRVVGLAGELRLDPSKPDGTPRKLMASDRLAAMGWRPTIGLEDGLRRAYAWFLENAATARAA